MSEAGASLEPDEVRAWRSGLRQRLIAARLAASPEQHSRWSAGIDRHLEWLLPSLASRTVGFCWPYKAEYDARGAVLRELARGASAALPVVVAPGSPLAFREWRPGCPMEDGAHGIPVPAASAAPAQPDVVLLPMNGFDHGGFRLGYGGGYFDRTFAAMRRRPVAIGLCFELGRMPTIRPQPHDIPLDYVVTEAGAWRRGAHGLEPVPSGHGQDRDRGDR